MRRALLVAALLCLAAPARSDAGFDAWLEALRVEARTRGISEATLEAALGGVQPRPIVIQHDRSQPRQPGDFCGYLAKRLTRTRIDRARRELATHRDALLAIEAEYGVPARYLVALWGLESNFGDYQGDHPLFEALVTLAQDPRRSELFRAQLLAALEIVEAGHPADRMRASWAGAMGQVQFMPTTYQQYAVDHDGDGHRDVWGSVPDALASAANFLRALGWRSGQTWGRQVQLPEAFAAEPSLLRGRRTLAGWRELGVLRSDGATLPDGRLHGRLVLPRRTPETAFLVYPNYDRFLSWNRSTFFAVSVGTLADEIAQRSTLLACRGTGSRRG